ncbi:pyridoxamine 5'-phosphate oxidase family protein [Robbsia sp. KACC 23696]|uniref:pyridoxamine 5'-phosphate oxidase family protein n=1 Tax=Robbsia sp. KACC 23696 TaxID=3149231 RepID=UPI00325A5122
MPDISLPFSGDTPLASPSPFHAGETAVQQRANVQALAETIGRRAIRDAMPEQHRLFFEAQPLMIFGGMDADAQPWATVRIGAPGFVRAPDMHTLSIRGGALPDDPLRDAWKVGAPIGGLGIQPHTRRRNRVNGVITSVDGDTVTLQVLQSFGNCPRYIQARAPESIDADSRATSVLTRRKTLSSEDRALISRSDTFFIASANTSADAGMAGGVDVSHRGGLPGFVHIDDDSTLTAPDYAGNKFFNTLGNLAQNPRAGLLFIDFTSGDLLYLATRADILWDAPEQDRFPLAERLVRFTLLDVRRSNGALPFRWTAATYARELAPPVAAL